MADFALWGAACEGAFWPPGTFMEAYNGNRNDAIESVIQDDPVSFAVQVFMKRKTAWEGTATELLERLNEQEGEGTLKQKGWPKAPNVLSGKLRRLATFLRKIGINVDIGKSGSRSIIISKTIDNTEKTSSVLSISSVCTENKVCHMDGMQTINSHMSKIPMETAQQDNKEINVLDDTDCSDAKIPASSAPLAGKTF